MEALTSTSQLGRHRGLVPGRAARYSFPCPRPPSNPISPATPQPHGDRISYRPRRTSIPREHIHTGGTTRARCRGQVRRPGHPACIGGATDGDAGFKKNVNRATTQVMMKTGECEPPGVVKTGH